MKKTLFLIAVVCSLFVSCQTNELNSDTIKKITRTESEWKKSLSTEEYHIIRENGTEPAFTGKYWNTQITGTYCCKACGLQLFDSETKFKSGTGWPSFFEAIGINVSQKTDNSYGWSRTEINCARCDGHLGHVFDDGPKPTGLRFCVNSASLTLQTTE